MKSAVSFFSASFLAGAALLLAGCGDSGTGAESRGSLRVTVTTKGRVLDRDGYTLRLTGDSVRVGINETVSLQARSGETRALVLEGVRHNCTVAGGESRAVQVGSGAPTQVNYEVTCAATDMALLRPVNGVWGLFVRRAGGEPQLLATPVSQSRVRWSPDGYKIAYTVPVNGSNMIEIIDVDSLTRWRYPGDGGSNSHPEWSPDGKRIVYRSTAGVHPANLFVMNADGTGAHQITPDPVGREQMPAWSPDGSRIAHVRTPGPDSHEIWTIRPDGSDPRLLATIRNRGYGTIDWSPDGTQIVYAEASESTGLIQVALMNADGTNRRQVTAGDRFSHLPTFTPDGRIAFFRDSQIWTVNADGSDARKVSRDDGISESSPDWP